MTRVRFIKGVTEEDIASAVHAARAVVALDDKVIRLTEEINQLKERIESGRRGAESASQERNRFLDRIFAVERLHHEREQVSCGDGCCHEGLGVCDYDAEPWPCKTVQALEGNEA